MDLSQPINLPDFNDLDLKFNIVDSHHHLFDLQAINYPWLMGQPEKHFLLGNYDHLKQNYSVADYRRDTGGLSVLQTVHVEAEADHDNPVAETRWLSTLMRNSELPQAIVAHAWLHQSDCEGVLEEQASFPAVRGIRSKPRVSTTAASRDQVRGRPVSMQDLAWRKGLGLLREYGFSWDLRVPFWHLSEAADVCALYPDLPVVVEHTGLPWDRSADGLGEWRRGMGALAELGHVYLKVSELGLASGPWDYIDNRQVVREAIEIFGFNRCMFASNFPVAGLRIGYVDQLSAIAHMVRDCSIPERNALFHDTAVKFYRL